MVNPKINDFHENNMRNVAKKVLNIGIPPDFFFFFANIQKENVYSNAFCKFQLHSMQFCFVLFCFFLLDDLRYLKIEKGFIHSSPTDFDGSPYPGKGGLALPLFSLKDVK